METGLKLRTCNKTGNDSANGLSVTRINFGEQSIVGFEAVKVNFMHRVKVFNGHVGSYLLSLFVGTQAFTIAPGHLPAPNKQHLF